MKKTSTQTLLTATTPETQATFEPRPHVILNILNYSKALSVKKSKSVKFIENILN